MRFVRSSRGFATVGSVLALLAVTVGVLVGSGSTRSLFDLGDGFAWLSSDDGSAVLVNGETGEGTFRINLEDGDFEIIYRDGQAYIRVERDGEVLLYRLDDSTFSLAGGREIGGREIQRGGDHGYLVDHDRGQVQPIDPTTLQDAGDAVNFTPPIQTSIGSDGLLVVVETADDRAVVLEGSSIIATHGIGKGGESVHAVTVGPHAAAANLSVHEAFSFRDTTAGRTEFRNPAGALYLSREAEGSVLPILARDDQHGALVMIHLVERSSRTVELAMDVSGVTDLYAAPRAIYLHDADDDLVYVVDPEDGATIEEVDLSQLGAGNRHIFLKDGLLWANNVEGELALVINEQGQVRRINKYDPDIPEFDTNEDGDDDDAPPPPAPERVEDAPDAAPPPEAPFPSLGVPGAPTSFSGVEGDRSVELSWVTPSDGGSAITGYRLSCTPDCGAQREISLGPTDSHLLDRLTNGTAYRFTLTAINEIGEGPPASTGPHTPSADIPDPPTRVSASPTATGAIDVDWNDSDAKGRSIETYSVYARRLGGPTPTSPMLTSRSTNARVPAGSFAVGDDVEIWITATTLEESQRSDPTVVRVLATPGTPTLELSPDLLDLTVTLNCDAACRGGADESDFTIELDGTMLTGTVGTLGQGSVTYTGLAERTNHTITGRVTNDVGTAHTAPRTYTTPGRPIAISVDGPRPSSGRIVTMAATVDDGGLPAECNFSANGRSSGWGSCAGAALDLTNGTYYTTYTATVAVRNAIGDGDGASGQGHTGPKARVADGNHWGCPGTFCGPNASRFASRAWSEDRFIVSGGTTVHLTCQTAGDAITDRVNNIETNLWVRTTHTDNYHWMSAHYFGTTDFASVVSGLPNC